MTAFDRVLAALGDRVKQRRQDGCQAQCPGHEDNRASLAVKYVDGVVLMKCHAGCDNEAIARALDIRMVDLFNEPRSMQKPRVVKTYPYRDEQGKLLYETCRFDPKDFRPRRPAPGGGWEYNMGDVRRVLYRLPELIASAPKAVFVPEGERDVDTVVSLGLVATTNVGGAGKWRPEYSEFLRGRYVVILPDNDDAGRKHAEQVRSMLTGIASSIVIVALPGLPLKGDVTDWVAGGGTRDQLLAMCKPPKPPTSRDAEIRRKLAAAVSLLSEVTELVSAAPKLTVVNGGRQ